MRRLVSLAALAAAVVGLLAAGPAAASTVGKSGTGTGDAAPGAVRPVPSVDLQRYSGRWLQLAAIPVPFLAECARDVAADYTPLADGTVRVVNGCTRVDGSRSTIEGRARSVDPATNSRLEVTFVRIGDRWQYQFAGAYWIIGLAPDYQWAVVGSPTRSGGYRLSRTPGLTPAQIAAVLAVLVRNGYDPCRFVLTPTTGGVPTAQGLCEL